MTSPPPPHQASRGPGAPLGIAITTLNRRALLEELLDAIAALTTTPHALIVCDDGSDDGTVEMVRARNIPLVGGVRRGIAWNKNRGLYYLSELCGCETILLLDDDICPVVRGWEGEWLAATALFGHVNWLPPWHKPLLSGRASPINPGVTAEVSGAVIALSRAALARVGYMDTRFIGYGNEHVDFTLRVIHAGFGGFTHHDPVHGAEARFFVITGGVEARRPPFSYTDPETIAHNLEVAQVSLAEEEIWRPPWRTPLEYWRLRLEMERCLSGAERIAVTDDELPEAAFAPTFPTAPTFPPAPTSL